jgi:hypothetical protein
MTIVKIGILGGGEGAREVLIKPLGSWQLSRKKRGRRS